jgi:putative DNA primase/helicase
MNALFNAPDVQGLAVALKLSPAKQGYIGSCPVCNYKGTFSLTLKQNKLLMYCHACNAPFNTFKEHFQRIGVWETKNRFYNPATAISAIFPKPSSSCDAKQYAWTLWNEGVAIKGTPVEAYLKHRAIDAVDHEALRFHPRLKHSPSDRYYTAMIAKVTDAEGRFMGIHRTYLDGHKKAPVTPNKMMLGNCKWGAVHFSKPNLNLNLNLTLLCIAEGIETALSVHQETGYPTWAALSTSGVMTLRFNQGLERLIICADHDEAGLKACNTLFDRAIEQGVSVKIIIPPHEGQDFNDVLREGHPHERN